MGKNVGYREPEEQYPSGKNRVRDLIDLYNITSKSNQIKYSSKSVINKPDISNLTSRRTSSS
jgi:hypothetical protein